MTQLEAASGLSRAKWARAVGGSRYTLPQPFLDYVFRAPLSVADILGRNPHERPFVHIEDLRATRAYQERAPFVVASVEIAIRDNGTGIPDEVKARMFNPFFTTKPAGEGTGLGLSLSHDIVAKQHGGTIEVTTEPGAFTMFTIIIPRAVAAA